MPNDLLTASAALKNLMDFVNKYPPKNWEALAERAQQAATSFDEQGFSDKGTIALILKYGALVAEESGLRYQPNEILSVLLHVGTAVGHFGNFTYDKAAWDATPDPKNAAKEAEARISLRDVWKGLKNLRLSPEKFLKVVQREYPATPASTAAIFKEILGPEQRRHTTPPRPDKKRKRPIRLQFT